MWFDFLSVYLHSSFTASIILDSFLDDLNDTTILTWYKSNKGYLTSYEFIQSGGAGMMNPKKVFMSRGKA